MNRLIATVGYPYAGKSKYVEGFHGTCYPIVETDAVRRAIHGQRFLKQAEPLVWYHVQVMIESLWLAGHQTVILDSCAHTAEYRKKWERHPDCKVEWRYVATPWATCLGRAQAIGDEVITPVLIDMRHTFEVPSEVANVETINPVAVTS